MNWIKNIVSHILPNTTPAAGADQADRKRTKGLKTQEEASKTAIESEKAREKGAQLSGMIQKGSAGDERQKLYDKARKKVAQNLDEVFDDPDIVDEVTERITEAAMNDPHYKKWVEK